MPTFDTPEPITATVELVAGSLTVLATDRTDTTVDVRPAEPEDPADVRAAGQVRVEYADGALTVRAPLRWQHLSPRGSGGTVDVTIELPTGSRLHHRAAMGDLRCSGRLDECQARSSLGHLTLEDTGPITLSTTGRVTVGRVAGRAEVSAAGAVRIGAVDGPAVLRNTNGATHVGEVTGDLKANAANGSITVDRALGAVRARSANGDIRLGEVVRGEIALDTAAGDIEVGVATGTAAWLDVNAPAGRVDVALDPAERPGGGDVVELRARTHFGDIAVRPAAS
ncbi:MAG TPA: DUF4097 family beta strand repeat-containing protein [Pseudonocardiaceae bacterium]